MIPELQFVDRDVAAYEAALTQLALRGAKSVELRPFNALAKSVSRAVSIPGLALVERSSFQRSQTEAANGPTPDAVALFEDDADKLSGDLLEYEHSPLPIIASKTSRYWRKLPLFLISIPKAGTHLLYKLAEVLGYEPRVAHHDRVEPGSWYCLEYSNSHTSARDFFVDTVRRSPFGNRLHPFPRSPALFIYRNPLDIVVSEANYYHKEGNTPFCGYLSPLDAEQRLLRLINDPWLLGSIRDRVGKLLPWLDFPNVIPLSFEELVGERGGGSLAAQTRLIWSLQLKLHAPGTPTEIAASLFDPRAPTFYRGQIGSYCNQLNEGAYNEFMQLPQDFMRLYGYETSTHKCATSVPTRAAEFRQRALRLGGVTFEDQQIGVDFNYLQHDIVRYDGAYYGLRRGSAVSDVAAESAAVRRLLPSADNLFALQSLLATERAARIKRVCRDSAVRLVKLWQGRRGESARTT